ncbi:MAG: hypothetical protein ACJ75H_11465 [Thermoanaerobaculia bacterium]
MARRSDVAGGPNLATPTDNLTPNLDPTHELPPTTSGNLGDLNASGSGPGVAQQAKEQAKNLAQDAKEQAKGAANQARDHVQELVGRQKDQAAERLGSLAGALREAGRKLNEGEQAGDFGRYADRAAEQVERLSTYLRDHDARSFVRDTETFARRRPDLFLGGTFIAGLMLARFLKASGPEQGTAGYDGGNYGGNWTGYPDSARRATAPAGTGTYSSYTPERRNPDEAGAGTASYNAPLAGV